MKRRFTLAVVGFLLTPSVEGQVPSPVGQEFQVNTYWTSRQILPSVGSDSAGNFVVIWQSGDNFSRGPDGSLASIQGQRYDQDGAPIGGEFQVNTYTQDAQLDPSLAVRAGGEFVVVWHNKDSSVQPWEYSIYGQRFGSDGQALGDEFQVNSYDQGPQRNARVAIADSGDFIVVWGDSELQHVRGQLFDATGDRLGEEFQVDAAPTPGSSWDPAVAMSASGEFVVVWRKFENGGAGYNWNIHGQRFDAMGVAAGVEFVVNSYLPESQLDPFIALSGNGRSVVSYPDYGQSEEMLRIYDELGQPIGPEFPASDLSFGATSPLTTAMRADGRFVAFWTDWIVQLDHYGLVAKYFESDGTALGIETLIRSDPENAAGGSIPSAAFQSEEEFVIVFHSPPGDSDGSYERVIGRRFALPFFADGFESGDTALWSETVP